MFRYTENFLCSFDIHQLINAQYETVTQPFLNSSFNVAMDHFMLTVIAGLLILPPGNKSYGVLGPTLRVVSQFWQLSLFIYPAVSQTVVSGTPLENVEMHVTFWALFCFICFCDNLLISHSILRSIITATSTVCSGDHGCI